jgi:aspartyl-tRNA(Asn)/glutamyl-tRNA(Gln) amidotransferase subunit A
MTPTVTISHCASALRKGATTSAALVEQALHRIAQPEGEGARAFNRVYTDAARQNAQVSDLLLTAGQARSEFEGLPISIKDLFDVAGETTLAGSVARDGCPAATADAVAVQRLKAAGAVIVGRTNMTEFAFSGLGINPHYGTPLNPWDRATGRIPGGSSSGAAVSVADGMALAGLGSDTGGSLRIPAALCGLVGFKPTASRVPTQGVLPLSTSLDSIGAIAPSVACCAQLDAILSGEWLRALHPALLKGLRLAVPTTVVMDGMDAMVASAFERALSRLSALGAVVQEMAFPAFERLATINAKGGLIAAEAWAWHRELLASAGDRYDPRVSSRIRRGEAMSAADYIDVLSARAAWTAQVRARMDDQDALVMPTVPVVAPPMAEIAASDEVYTRANLLMLRNPTLINFLDGCALSLPCHAEGDAPVGLMLAAGELHDQRLLSIGLAVESALRPT